ncbi:hypothetical protein D3C80_950600 [compost metagenome]
MAEPVGEAPLLALEVGSDVGSHHPGLDQEGADAAHRVAQRAALGGDARPAGTDEDRRGEVFLERRRALLQAVAALVQAEPGQVQRQHQLAALQARMHAQVGLVLVHRRALTGRGAQAVDDAVLDLEGTEVGVVDAGATAGELHRQAAGGQQVLAPVDRTHGLVQCLGVVHREAAEDQQHAVGQTRPQTQAIGGFQAALPLHGGHLRASVEQPQCVGLLEQQGFQALGTGENEWVQIGHAVFQGQSP